MQAIETVFDPATRNRLNTTGLEKGWKSLEIGPGAGSIMDWLGERVGPLGHVVAVDLNPRFLERKGIRNIEVLKENICDVDFGHTRFDLIHARYVMIHIPNYQSILKKILQLLKPGGWFVLEEPDFSTTRALCGDEASCASFERVNRALRKMYTKMGIDHTIGLKLPGIFQSLGISNFQVDHDVPISRGGSSIARLMRMSAIQLRDKYIATGEVRGEDVEAYCAFADNPETWAIYYATIAVTAQF